MVDGLSSLQQRNVRLREPPAPAASQEGTASSVQRYESRGDRSSERRPADAGQIQAVAGQINEALQKVDGRFSVSVDDATGMVVVRIKDSHTGEVVKQIPPQQILDANVSVERIVGLLVNDQA